MKKKFTLLSSFAALSLVFSANVNSQYHGNSDWSERPDHALIYSTNFQDWNYADAMRPATSDCNTGRETAALNYFDTFEMKKDVDAQQGMSNAKITFFADFCQIQPTCDTQSGQNYVTCPTCTGNDYKGASWDNVSVGCIAIYDNYNSLRPAETYPGAGGTGAGSFATSLIARLGTIQYTASSYGNTRGFHLEVGYLQSDNSVRWDTIRYTPKAASVRYPVAMQTEDLTETNRGTVWQENFTPAKTRNVFIRFRPVSHEPQIVRIHDLKIYGEAVDTDGADAVNPNDLSVYVEGENSIDNSTTSSVRILGGKGGVYTLTDVADVNVYNMSGNVVKSIASTTDIDLSELASGAYIIKAVAKDGVITKQIVK